MKMNGARIVAQCLVEEGVKVLFGIPGGTITPFYDVLPEFPLHHVLVRHEARGRPTWRMVTPGPLAA